jgi:hypothetical protein
MENRSKEKELVEAALKNACELVSGTDPSEKEASIGYESSYKPPQVSAEAEANTRAIEKWLWGIG